MRTEAWRSLDPVARCAYIELAKSYNGSNNGRIAFSLRQMAVGLNVGKMTARRALQKLQDGGVIVEVQRGAFSYKLRHATTWRLTEHVDDVTGALPTKDFARWQEKNAVSPENPNRSRDDTDRVS